jgi:P27 family predicted phage terminase small subunit
VIYCEAWADYREACTSLADDGRILRNDKGKSFINPALALRDQAARTMQDSGKVLGLLATGPRWADYAAVLLYEDEPAEGEVGSCP